MNIENIRFLPVKTRYSITGVNLTLKKLREIRQGLEEKMIPREGRSVILDEDNFLSLQEEFRENFFTEIDPKKWKDVLIYGMKIIVDRKVGSHTYSVNYYE